jgi:hypothetical protein
MTKLQYFIRRLNDWAYVSDFSPTRAWRKRRMRSFLKLMKPSKGSRIVDLGGSPFFWNLIDHNFDITIVNLPNSGMTQGCRYKYVIADACKLHDIFAEKEFDIAFSNSVIEHVGDLARQQAFASEAMRIANSYWVQTPSDRFPIEAHTGVWYYWRRSESCRATMIDSWSRTLPGWAEMIRETRVLSKQQMMYLFPGCTVYTENVFGFEKSITAYGKSA